MNPLVLLLIPVSLSFAHYCGLRWDIKSRNYVQSIRSFSAGFSVTYIFRFLLPEVIRLNGTLGIEPMLLVLLGFVFFHSTLKFIFKTRHEEETTFLLDEIHLIAAGLYNFLVTFLLVMLAREDPFQGVVIFGVIILHLILSEIAHAVPTTHETNLHKTQLVVMATILGALTALFNIVTTIQADILFAVTVGAMMYIVVREEIPEESDGRPLLFIAGSGILILAHLIV